MNLKAIAFWIGVALAAPVHAQYSGSEAGAFSGSASHSGAAAGAAVIINNPAIPSSTQNRQDLNYDGHYNVKTVPNVVVPNILPSAVCHGTSSAGVSVLGFGVGGGSSWQDADCQYRETARVFHAMGMGADAVAVLCSSGFAANAPTCKGMPKPTPTKAEADTGTKIGEPGQPGGGERERTRADAEFCNRPEVRGDAILAERNGCVVAAASALKRGPR